MKRKPFSCGAKWKFHSLCTYRRRPRRRGVSSYRLTAIEIAPSRRKSRYSDFGEGARVLVGGLREGTPVLISHNGNLIMNVNSSESEDIGWRWQSAGSQRSQRRRAAIEIQIKQNPEKKEMNSRVKHAMKGPD